MRLFFHVALHRIIAPMLQPSRAVTHGGISYLRWQYIPADQPSWLPTYSLLPLPICVLSYLLFKAIEHPLFNLTNLYTPTSDTRQITLLQP